MSSTRSVCRFR